MDKYHGGFIRRKINYLIVGRVVKTYILCVISDDTPLYGFWWDFGFLITTNSCESETTTPYYEGGHQILPLLNIYEIYIIHFLNNHQIPVMTWYIILET